MSPRCNVIGKGTKEEYNRMTLNLHLKLTSMAVLTSLKEKKSKLYQPGRETHYQFQTPSFLTDLLIA